MKADTTTSLNAAQHDRRHVQRRFLSLTGCDPLGRIQKLLRNGQIITGLVEKLIHFNAKWNTM